MNNDASMETIGGWIVCEWMYRKWGWRYFWEKHRRWKKIKGPNHEPPKFGPSRPPLHSPPIFHLVKRLQNEHCNHSALNRRSVCHCSYLTVSMFHHMTPIIIMRRLVNTAPRTPKHCAHGYFCEWIWGLLRPRWLMFRRMSRWQMFRLKDERR